MAEATQAMGTLLPPSPEPHSWGRPFHRIGGLPRWTHAGWSAEEAPADADHATGVSGRSAPRGPAPEHAHRSERYCAAPPSSDSGDSMQ
eukprot:4945308-Pyramimonas_sp.AAC.1